MQSQEVAQKAQETVKKAMSNGQAISFEYCRIGRAQADNIENARVVLMSTDSFGKDGITVDILKKNALKKSAPDLRYFDLSNVSNLVILSSR